MAGYTTGTLVKVGTKGSIGLWEYNTTDALATVNGSGYISDGGTRGMALGDEVDVRIWSSSVPALTKAGKNAATLSKAYKAYAKSISTAAITLALPDAS